MNAGWSGIVALLQQWRTQLQLPSNRSLSQRNLPEIPLVKTTNINRIMQYFIIAATLVLVCLGSTAVNAFIAGSRFISQNTHKADTVEFIQGRQSAKTHTKTWWVLIVHYSPFGSRLSRRFSSSILTKHANIHHYTHFHRSCHMQHCCSTHLWL